MDFLKMYSYLTLIIEIAQPLIELIIIICFLNLCKNIKSINTKMDEIQLELLKLKQMNEKE